MQAQLKPLVLLATGGTGGHVTPAEALADELISRGYRVAMVTDPRGKFFNKKTNLPVFSVASAGVADRSLLAKAKAVYALAKGFFQARSIIKFEQPAAVVGFGGYSSVPTCLAANHCNVPLIIHEQNAVLGRANRLLASRASAIATAFPKILGVSARDKNKIVVTGNPVRRAILEAALDSKFKSPSGRSKFKIFVVGGSQGSRRFAQIIPHAISLLSKDLQKKVEVIQQVRRENFKPVKDLYDKLGIKYELKEFFENMPRRLSEAHILVCRAGASTVFEIAAMGRPAILVPYPYAIYDHQTVNASIVEDAGGGWLVPQNVLYPETLADMLSNFIQNPSELANAAHKVRQLSRPDAAKRLANLVERAIDDNQG